MQQADYTPDEWTTYLHECVERFYRGDIAADERAELEDEILAFRQAEWSWRLCRHIMLHSRGDVRLQWLAASVLHDASTRNLQEQTGLLRLEVWDLLVHESTTEVAREKLASAIVGMAMRGWPSVYCDLIPQVQTAASILPHASLLVVRGIVEELDAGSNQCTSRYNEVKQALHQDSEHLCNLAYNALNDGATAHPSEQTARAAMHALATLAKLASICSSLPIISAAAIRSAASTALREWPTTVDAARMAECVLHFLADVFLIRRLFDIPSAQCEVPIDHTAAEVLSNLLVHMGSRWPSEVPTDLRLAAARALGSQLRNGTSVPLSSSSGSLTALTGLVMSTEPQVLSLHLIPAMVALTEQLQGLPDAKMHPLFSGWMSSMFKIIGSVLYSATHPPAVVELDLFLDDRPISDDLEDEATVDALLAQDSKRAVPCADTSEESEFDALVSDIGKLISKASAVEPSLTAAIVQQLVSTAAPFVADPCSFLHEHGSNVLCDVGTLLSLLSPAQKRLGIAELELAPLLDIAKACQTALTTINDDMRRHVERSYVSAIRVLCSVVQSRAYGADLHGVISVASMALLSCTRAPRTRRNACVELIEQLAALNVTDLRSCHSWLQLGGLSFEHSMALGDDASLQRRMCLAISLTHDTAELQDLILPVGHRIQMLIAAGGAAQDLSTGFAMLLGFSLNKSTDLSQLVPLLQPAVQAIAIFASQHISVSQLLLWISLLVTRCFAVIGVEVLGELVRHLVTTATSAAAVGDSDALMLLRGACRLLHEVASRAQVSALAAVLQDSAQLCCATLWPLALLPQNSAVLLPSVLKLMFSLLVATGPCELPLPPRTQLINTIVPTVAVRAKLQPAAHTQVLSFLMRLDDAGRMLDVESYGVAIGAELFKHLLESLISEAQPGLVTEQLQLAARIAERKQLEFLPTCLAPALAQDSALAVDEREGLCTALTVNAAEPGAKLTDALAQLVRNIHSCYARLGS